MLKKENRLNSKEFQETFKTGKRFFYQNFLFIIKSNTENFKAGVSISKKQVRLATQRNKIKREIYNLLYILNKQKIHIIIQIKNKNFKFVQVEKELNKML